MVQTPHTQRDTKAETWSKWHAIPWWSISKIIPTLPFQQLLQNVFLKLALL